MNNMFEEFQKQFSNSPMGKMPFPFCGMNKMPFPFPFGNNNNSNDNDDIEVEIIEEGENTENNENCFPFNLPFFEMMKQGFPFCGNQQQFPFPGMMKQAAFFGKMKKQAPNFIMPMMAFPFPLNNGGENNNGNPQFMNMPKDVLKKLLKIDASPQDLEKLQKVLDFVFDLYSKRF